MYAQRRLKREQNMIGGNLFFAFGSVVRANRGAGDGVSEVQVEIDERGTYWGWIPRLGIAPIYITDSEVALAAFYASGDMTRDISADEKAGLGQIVQLHVRETKVIS
jgi:hypothetical protein